MSKPSASSSHFRLSNAHLAQAMQIVHELRAKKPCRNCFDRGWKGINEKNQLIICYKCTNPKAVMKAWKEYVQKANDPGMNEEYQELLNDDPQLESPLERRTELDEVEKGRRCPEQSRREVISNVEQDSDPANPVTIKDNTKEPK